ncbi:MAG: hypothetical protein K2P14_02450 [Anaeroplasmataceae bacterium]|nr:hypothetical protein [Anaeroplasmataceae bacterium]
MKRYKNIAYTVVVSLPISCVGCLVGIILGCVFYNGDLIGAIAMCTTLSFVIIMIFALLILLNDELAVTYYDDEKIIQKSFFKRKQIKYEDIKEIYVSGDCIYFTSKEYNLKFDEKEKKYKVSRKIYKILKHEIIIMISSDAVFLKNINLENIKVHIFKHSIRLSVDKYLKP